MSRHGVADFVGNCGRFCRIMTRHDVAEYGGLWRTLSVSWRTMADFVGLCPLYLDGNDKKEGYGTF